MIPLILSLAVAQTPNAAFAIKDLAYQPESKVTAVVGPKIRMGKHVPGLYFDRPGFDRIFVDAAGPTMTRMSVRPKWLAPWKVALQRFGIDAGHAVARQLPVPHTKIPLTRNSLEIVGAKGVPVSPKTQKPLRLNYIECAVVNKERARVLRPKIMDATGDAKFQLIRQCYDWYSELDLKQ